MDYHPNMVSVTSVHEEDDSSKLGGFQFSSTLNHGDLCSSQMTTEVDVSLEWLSAFVEECLSTKGSSLPLPLPPVSTQLNKPSRATSLSAPSSSNFAVPGKARSKRRRPTSNTNIHPLAGRRIRQLNPLQNKHPLQLTASSSDPLLLQQTYWLADSELLLPLPHKAEERGKVVEMDERETTIKSLKQQQQQSVVTGRRCSHCLAQRTPQWRGGPLGPKTLCNACGVRYKSGRLLPEYRPAKSPTFVSFLHSNSHKRVMEMRMMNAFSSSTTFPSSS